MTIEVSPLRSLRRLVNQAEERGGRINLLSYTVKQGIPDSVVHIGESERRERFQDYRGPLNDLFIEQTGRSVSPTELVMNAHRHPEAIIHEQYFDIRRATAVGKEGVRIGVEIIMDDGGELKRTFFVNGPSWGTRLKRRIRTALSTTKNHLPPDRYDAY